MRLALLLILAACESTGPLRPLRPTPPRELVPVPNPFGPTDPAYAPQPHRDRPGSVVGSLDGRTLYVALTGTESEPGREVAVVDAESLAVRGRIAVGPGPLGMAIHPAGRHLLVTNRFAAYVSVVDLVSERVIAEVPTPYYTEGVVFTPAGDRAYLINRWKDSLLRWIVVVRDGEFRGVPLDRAAVPSDPVGLPLPKNPRRIAITQDGSRLLITSDTSLSLTVVDTERDEIVGVYRPNSPVLDAALVGRHLVVAHTGQGTGHPPDDGFDGDEDGLPGDGTANVIFQDLQNELDVLDLASFERLHRYTSDSICCGDYRDVDPAHPERGGGLAGGDAWPASRVATLPPTSTWIVAGALPERLVAITRPDGSAALAVVFGGSSEVQTFDVDSDSGSLTARETAASGLYRTGFGAVDAVAVDGGRRLVVVDRLSESLTKLDLWAEPSSPGLRGVVGDVSGGEFPATDAELGEAFNTVTAAFTVDGDQTCVHCHRDGSPIGKPITMPLLEQPEWGMRSVMSYRGAYDTRPWFVEAAMDESNFFPVINEFARRENFCCEQVDRLVWSRYPSHADCTAEPERAGCSHVLRCTEDPPPECAQRPYGVPALTRDAHFRAASLAVIGRDTSFGDALYAERVGADGRVERRPITLGFEGITRALGLFLLNQFRVLPNPNGAVGGVAVDDGEALFFSARTGCSSCHLAPSFGTARATAVSEAMGPIRFPLLVSPLRHPTTGVDVDRVQPGFIATFPDTVQTAVSLHTGSPPLRGAWDRLRFLHHGAARSIREVLATPGHPGLGSGERGHNERDGQLDTHGGTSRLSARELDALTAFVEAL